MDLEWDEAKRLRILRERGLDFADAAVFFDGRPTMLVPSSRLGEERFCSIALVDGVFLTLVWTWREQAIRVISMRRAHGKEARQYRQLYA